MRISSKYATQKMSRYSLRISFIHLWNETGALVSPNGMTVLVESVLGAERCFLRIPGPNPEVVIGVLNVKLGVDGGTG